SGNGGAGGPGFPIRTIWPPPAVGKHGLAVSLLQQFWARPPLASMQIGSPVEGSVPMLTQASPVQLFAPHPDPPQLSSWDAPHGFGPANLAVPEVSGSRMSSGATSAAGSGGQLEDRLYTLSPIAWATVIVDSTVQARPVFAPLSHCPSVQRGQTFPRVVRCTSEVRFT